MKCHSQRKEIVKLLFTKREKTVAERVQAGIKLLDKKEPHGWRTQINLEILNLQRTDNCILGQLHGDYDSGRNRLFAKPYEWGFDYGFSARGDNWDDLIIEYEKLTEEWKVALSA
jgi:hypothetical protein